MFGQKNEVNVNPDLEMFTIYDSKSQSYGKPIFAKNKDVLLRDTLEMFRDPTQQKENQLFTNAEDFSIFRVGKFFFSTGNLDSEKPQHIANLHDLRSLVKPGALSST